MPSVLGCIIFDHNPWLVLVAAIICITGSWTITRLFFRATATKGVQRMGWHVLAAVAAGAAIWCTHFIAMLGFKPGVPVSFDPVLTISSMLVAVVSVGLGLVIASGNGIYAPAFGGAIVGLGISAMHYTGMIAYRVQGLVSWDKSYLIASIVLSATLSAIAFVFARRRSSTADKYLAAAMLTLAIIVLHFTGMTAFHVIPMYLEGEFSDPAALQSLAIAVGAVALMIVSAGLASYLIDGSMRSETYEQLRQMAMSDTLTGLPNRASFNERLAREIGGAKANSGKLAVVLFDLDDFKDINDLQGHSVGDEVLKIVAQRVSRLLRDDEFIARLGGDEFAAIYTVKDQAGLIEFLSRIEAAVLKPIRIGDYEVSTSASIGTAIYPDDAHNSATLVSNADLAMYRAKADPGRTICFYEPSMDETVRARKNLVSELRLAVERNGLEVHYQPQASVVTGDIRGYEALARWTHSRYGVIAPSEFIPLAEESGLILPIGEWVLRTACAAAASWNPNYKVSVNLSAVQFAHVDLPKLIADVLAETGLDPHRLELELTESTIFVDKKRSLQILHEIKALGVGIALDDFGTGYSSLETLRSFPFDKIKLDRSFMNELESSPQSKAIIRAVLALGKSLEIPVLAEGVETRGQLALLSAEGCDEVQGYLLGRPVPLNQLATTHPVAGDAAPSIVPGIQEPEAAVEAA